MRPRSDRPVRRRAVLAGTVAAAAVLAAIIGLAEGLRHPEPGLPPLAPPVAEDADPRIPTVCPDPPPREGIGRDEDGLAPVQAPIEVNSDDLLNCPHTYDRRTVAYRGEAIGGVLRRDDGVWVQLNDDVYADPAGPLPAHQLYRGGNAGLGVLVPWELAESIRTVGGPKTHGDLLAVVGVFHRVDPATREVAVIRAASLDVVRPGGPVPDRPLADRQVAAAALAILAVGTVLAQRVAANRRARP